MERGHVVALSCDANGKVMGWAHSNPILDTRMYQVEFLGSEVMELTANVIAELIYAHCDADGDEYLPLDLLINYQNDNKAISITDQQTSIWGKPVTHKTNAGWQI